MTDDANREVSATPHRAAAQVQAEPRGPTSASECARDSCHGILEFESAPPEGPRNRLTVFFRPLLALPHIILVGAPPLLPLSLSLQGTGSDGGAEFGAHAGVLGAVAGICALISWFTILFAGKHPEGLWGLGHLFLRWRARALPYMLLLRDEYPPFGDDPYPVRFDLQPPEGPRDRLRVGLRLLIAIPYIFLLTLLGLVLTVVMLIAWLTILVTGKLSPGLHDFIVRFIRWELCLETFFLLLRDEFPPLVPGKG